MNNSKKIRKITVVILIFLCLFSDSLLKAGEAEKGRHVLVLFSYKFNMPWQKQLTEGLVSTFNELSGNKANILAEYTGLAVFSDPTYKRKLTYLLKSKYAHMEIDLIINAGEPSSIFFNQNQDLLFPGIPVVYITDSPTSVKSIGKRASVVIADAVDIWGTIDMALKIIPGTKNIAVVAGSSSTSQKYLTKTRDVLKSVSDKVTVTWLAGLPVQNLLERISKLPPDSIVLYFFVFQDEKGNPLIPRQTLISVAEKSDVPLFTLFDATLGAGTVGGKMNIASVRGRMAAEKGIELMEGRMTSGIEVVYNESRYIFDWRQLQKWNIDEDLLPAGSIIRYREISPIYIYRWHIAGVLALLAFETCLIIFLVINRRKRIEAERELQKAHDNLEVKVEERTRDLTKALEEVKVLSGLLPICSSCKKIRDDQGYWNLIDQYIEKHSDVQFTHGICEDCAEKLYGNEKWFKKSTED